MNINRKIDRTLTVTINFMPPAPQESVTIMHAVSGSYHDRVYVVRLQDGTSRAFPLEHIWEVLEMPDLNEADPPAEPTAAKKKP